MLLSLFFQKSTAQEIIGHFEGKHADLVVCDGAPDGMRVFKNNFYVCYNFTTNG